MGVVSSKDRQQMFNTKINKIIEDLITIKDNNLNI